MDCRPIDRRPLYTLCGGNRLFRHRFRRTHADGDCCGPGGGGPTINNNVFVFAEHVFFSDFNPGIGEEIFVFAYINFSGTDDPVPQFTVKLNDIFPVAGALETFTVGITLAGTTASSFGFLVTQSGVGAATFNVGDAFGVANGSQVAILDLLFATNDRSTNGVLYDLDCDGDANDDWETLLCTLANDVYSAANEAGGI